MLRLTATADYMRFMSAWFSWWRQHCYLLQYFTGCSTAFTGINLAKMPDHAAPRRPMSQARPSQPRQDRADVEHYKVSRNRLVRLNDFFEPSLPQVNHPKDKTVA
jgi:hypothetical protein